MSRYNSNYRPKFGWLWTALVVIGGAALIALMCVEFFSTRTFVGYYVGRDSIVSYSHDWRRWDSQSNSYIGENKTEATRHYYLLFSDDGNKIRQIWVGSRSAHVPMVRADAAALVLLNATTSDPVWFSMGVLREEYLVRCRGWLWDGGIVDMTPLDAIGSEK